MSEHERKNLTFNPAVLDLAERLMKLRNFSDLSGFLSQLVREEDERRNGLTLYDRPTPPSPAQSSAGGAMQKALQAENYTAKTKGKKRKPAVAQN